MRDPEGAEEPEVEREGGDSQWDSLKEQEGWQCLFSRSHKCTATSSGAVWDRTQVSLASRCLSTIPVLDSTPLLLGHRPLKCSLPPTFTPH